MLKQILTLSKVQLRNLFGINELRYTKDKKKKRSILLLAVGWFLVIFMVVAYVGSISAGFHMLEMGSIVPMYLYTLLSLIMLVFSFFKAGSILFSMKSYDIMVSLPVTKSAILISRFVTMYVTNLLLALVVMLPGLAVHIYFETPGISFYLVSIPVILLAPLLPLTISSIIGAVLKAISSRMRKKSLVEAFLTMLFVVVVLIGSINLGEQAETMDMEQLKDILSTAAKELGGIFPPALWYHEALQGNLLSFLLLIALPALIFITFVWLLGKRFQEICSRLNATYAKNDYKVKRLKSGSLLSALWKKEAKMYFSSSLYVTNTIVGLILALILAVVVAVMGVEKLAVSLGAADFVPLVKQLLPFVFSIPLCMMSATYCSISMEGNRFWQAQVLPIRAKDFYHGKLLWNLTLAAPFYLVSVILLLIAVQPDAVTALHYVLLPLVFLLFSIVLGLAANLLFPLLNWDNEARVVKQSASAFVSMFVGIIAILVPAVLAVALQVESYHIYLFLVEGIFLLITVVLYMLATKKELISIAQ